jgi:predicted  nucleic acid-binding Zn-ribbon protein
MMDLFVLVSGTISIVAVVPLGYLAMRGVLEARELRRIQHDLAALMHDNRAVAQDVHRLQHELRNEQDAAKLRIDETKRTVDHVTAIVEETAERLTEVVTDAGAGNLRGAHQRR